MTRAPSQLDALKWSEDKMRVACWLASDQYDHTCSLTRGVLAEFCPNVKSQEERSECKKLSPFLFGRGQ